MTAPESSDRVRDSLAERARVLAKRADHGDDDSAAAAVAVVAIGAETFGLPVANLREIVPLQNLTGLPGLKSYVRGLTQIRGELVLAVDLSVWYGIAPAGEPRFLAVATARDRILGLLVRQVLGFQLLGAARTAEGYSAGGTSDRHVRFVTTDMISVLDLERLLNEESLFVGTSTS